MHRVGSKSRNLTLRADNFSLVFDRKSLGHRDHPSVGIVGFDIRQSFTGADGTYKFQLMGHVTAVPGVQGVVANDAAAP